MDGYDRVLDADGDQVHSSTPVRAGDGDEPVADDG